MTPKEKWKRLNHPSCATDYGLSLTSNEMRQFPEGRKLVADALRYKRSGQRLNIFAEQLAIAARKTMEYIFNRPSIKEIEGK